AAAEQGVSVMRDRLRPAAPIDADKLARLLKDLDSPNFEVRDKASRELVEIGQTIVAPLRKALSKSPAPEVRRRVEEVLELSAPGRPRAKPCGRCGRSRRWSALATPRQSRCWANWPAERRRRRLPARPSRPCVAWREGRHEPPTTRRPCVRRKAG